MFLLIFLSVFMITVKIGAGVNCSDDIYFQFEYSDEHSLTAVTSNFSILVVSITETLAIYNDLYYIMTKSDSMILPYPDEDTDRNTALEYIRVSSSDSFVRTILEESVLGLADYGHDGRMTDLDLFLYFQYDSVDFPNVCKLQISHHIVDVNTHSPYFDQSSYSVKLSKNFPLYYPIEELQVKVYDNDAAPPNNVLSVQISGCPLGVNDTSYVPQKGSVVLVPVFLLTTPLYSEYNCTLNVSDWDFSAYSYIYVSVTPAPVAEPVLSSEFYTGTLMSIMVDSVVIVVPEISATDPDYPSIYNPKIVYSLTGTDMNGAEEYFQMNSSTGIVTVIKEISQDLLPSKAVSFKFTACDEDFQCTIGFLTIKLPYINLFAANSLQFEKIIYSVEVADPVKGDELLQVNVQTTFENLQNIIYSFAGDSSDQLYFNIEESSGIISLSTASPSTNTYTVKVKANIGIINTTSEVNIKISSKTDQLVFTNESRVSLTASEWFYSLYYGNQVLYTINAEEAGVYCLLHVEPSHFQGCFEVEKFTGNLKVIQELDIDNDYRAYGNIIHVRVGAYRDELTDCDQYNSSYISNIIYKNEVEIEIEVIDYDEYQPYFTDKRGDYLYEYVFGYPTESRLQKILPKVGTLKVEDYDYTPVYDVSSSEIKNSKYYDMDIPTISILPIGGGYVPDVSSFYVWVNNSKYESDTRTLIYPLELENIFTLRMNNVNLSQIEETIIELSKEKGFEINLLYLNFIKKNDDNNLWTVDAHAYGNYGSYLYSFSNVISVWDYGDDTNLSEYPREFADKKYFYSSEEDTDYKTAMIVLSTILGCLCVGVFGFYLCIGLKKFMGK